MKKKNEIVIDGKCHILVADNSDEGTCSSCSLKDNKWCTNYGCFCYDIMNASHHHFELEEKLNKKKLMTRNAKSTWWTVNNTDEHGNMLDDKSGTLCLSISNSAFISEEYTNNNLEKAKEKIIKKVSKSMSDDYKKFLKSREKLIKKYS